VIESYIYTIAKGRKVAGVSAEKALQNESGNLWERIHFSNFIHHIMLYLNSY